MTATAPTVFVSYAWEDDIKLWVREFATRLRSDGIDAKIDQWDMALGDQLPAFMERAVRTNDFVLIVCTPKYKVKSDARLGGVGYEDDIITAEVFTKANHRKFIPILRKGEWTAASPSFLGGKLYCDLRGDPYSEVAYQELLKTLHGQLTGPPPIGPSSGSGGGVPGTGGPSSPATVTSKNQQGQWRTVRFAAAVVAGLAMLGIIGARFVGTRGPTDTWVPPRVDIRPELPQQSNCGGGRQRYRDACVSDQMVDFIICVRQNAELRVVAVIDGAIASQGPNEDGRHDQEIQQNLVKRMQSLPREELELIMRFCGDVAKRAGINFPPVPSPSPTPSHTTDAKPATVPRQNEPREAEFCRQRVGDRNAAKYAKCQGVVQACNKQHVPGSLGALECAQSLHGWTASK